MRRPEINNQLKEKLLARSADDFLDLTNDALFKYLFGKNDGKHRTIALLNSLLEQELKHKIIKLNFLPTETKAKHKDEKTCRLDVYCSLDSGERVNIEMQRLKQQDFIQRTLKYWSNCFDGQLEKGEYYENLVPVICVNILDFVLFDDLDDYLNIATIHLEKHNRRLCDYLRLVFIELPKLKLSDNMSEQEKWLMLLNPDIPFQIKEKIAMNDAVMTDTLSSCKKFSSDFVRRWKYAQEQRAELDRISRDAHCRDEGIEIGIVKGQEEKATQIAINLMKQRISLDSIMQAVDFSREKLLDLARKNNIEINM